MIYRVISGPQNINADTGHILFSVSARSIYSVPVADIMFGMSTKYIQA